jgi:hypothetical protein
MKLVIDERRCKGATSACWSAPYGIFPEGTALNTGGSSPRTSTAPNGARTAGCRLSLRRMPAGLQHDLPRQRSPGRG